MHLRPLEPNDLPRFRSLCERPDIALDLDLDLGALDAYLQVTTGVNVAIGAFDGDELVGAAGFAALNRARLRHVGHAWLAAGPRCEAAARPLLDAIGDVAFDWWHLDRLELSLPEPSSLHAHLPPSFHRELVRRLDFDRDGTLVDSWLYARIREGVSTSAPPRAFPRPDRAPLPPSFELRGWAAGDEVGWAGVLMDPNVVWATLQSPFTPIEVTRRRSAANDPERNKLFVATVDGETIGSGGLHAMTGKRRHVWMLGMGVQGAWQGRGVGAQIMTRLMEVADELAIVRVQLDVFVDNTRAIALYERFGFEHEGRMRLDAWRDGRYADGLGMSRVRSRTHP